ncbi:MAG: hypothetical protein H0X37_06500 [Herpetosiphonaceae bacterium]|nr:hypothetical protein [Herpetosiphonaceae bacterium]
MYILDLCKTMITGFAEGQLPPPEQVARVVTDPIGRREVLAHPAFAIALMEEARRISGLDCEEVGDQLALAFPPAAAATSSVLSTEHFILHLQLCPFCAEEYGLARDIEAAQDAGILPPWPRPAPPGASTPPSVRWLPPLDLVVPNMPLKVPTSQVSRAWRGEHVAGQIVYADAVPGSELLLRATLTQLAAATPDSWELEVEIMPPPQTSYRLRLQHGTATVETDADSSGIARFSGIPDAWITAEPPLSLSVGMP